MEVSCLILAGGKSSRLRNKPFLILKGKPLVRYVFDNLREMFSEIIVVVKSEKDKEKMEEIIKNCKVVADKSKIFSPMAGIIAGIKHIKNNFVFVVACDMPFIEKKTVRELISRIDKNVNCVCYAYSLDKFEPLCAIYKKEFLQKIGLENSLNEAIRKEKNKALVPIVKETYEFFNVNTKKDFEVAEKLLS
ncbi:MAG: molybdenum cofactor guanylyltransferase [Candidatus Aenigmatarchaeota archaeon]